MSVVGVTKSTYSEIHDKIPLAIERGGGLQLRDGDRLVIKINLCEFKPPENGAVTHPVFLDAVLDYLRSLPTKLEILVVESNATVARPDKLVHWLGIQPVLDKHRVGFVNLSNDEKIKRPIAGRHFHEIEVPKVIANADQLITIPKMKTHLLSKITCCLKNQYGCIPYQRKIRFHSFLDDAIVDAALAMKPDFCIVDGILGMGGIKGPDLGVPIKSNVVVTGKDPVAVDSVCATIMGFDPVSIGHIRKAEESGIGETSFKIRGEELTEVRKNFEYNHLYASLLRSIRSLK